MHHELRRERILAVKLGKIVNGHYSPCESLSSDLTRSTMRTRFELVDRHHVARVQEAILGDGLLGLGFVLVVPWKVDCDLTKSSPRGNGLSSEV